MRTMPKAKSSSSSSSTSRAGLGFEKELWNAADHLRGSMDPSEYKHVVLGLLFLKYISDAFEARREELRAAVADPESDYFVEEERREEELEYLLAERDEYTLAHVFWVPESARWETIRAEAKQSTIGKTLDQAMVAIERDNPRLKGVLPKVFAKPNLDKDNLGKLIDKFSGVDLGHTLEEAHDVLGRVYEYFLGRFASAEGRGGGEFYTPQSVVRVLVEMIEPYGGRVYDPCCGSGGMFVQSVDFVRAHGGQRDEVSIYGQESNYTTWRLAQMNLAVRGIEADLGDRHADSFREDLHPDVRADFILANPPFNISEWHGDKLRNDPRWKYGTPPEGNANFAWVQHMVHHLAPEGVAGFVLANGSMSSMSGGEGEIRRSLVEAELVDCMVAMPGQLFYQTQIPVCLWFLAKNRGNGKFRDRRGEVLFVDARDLGVMESRTLRVFREEDVRKIADAYHAWRNPDGEYEDVAGFCKSATLEDIVEHNFILNPGRYVGTASSGHDDVPTEELMPELAAELRIQIREGKELDTLIEKNLQELGW